MNFLTTTYPIKQWGIDKVADTVFNHTLNNNIMQRVINFSGGRTSAYMTLMEYKYGDLVIFTDTGREHPKTYEFIDNFESEESIPIIRLKYEGGFKRLISKRKMLPNVAMRFCTIELKIKTARRYLRSIGIKNYINIMGFRYDEPNPNRVKDWKEYWKTVKTIFPLYEKKITKPIIIEFWKNKSYNLETPPILGNCDLCFLKGKNALIQIMRQQPELADKWIEDEEKMGNTYINGVSYKELLRLSKLPYYTQNNLFDIEPAFNCACTT